MRRLKRWLAVKDEVREMNAVAKKAGEDLREIRERTERLREEVARLMGK